MPYVVRHIPLLIAAAVLAAGCNQNQRAADAPPLEGRVMGEAPQSATPAAPAGLELGGVRMQPAPEWQDLGASAMRKAQYRLAAREGDSAPADVNVFFFGAGQGGDIEANIVRWIAQMKTADGQDAARGAVRSKLTTSNGLEVHFVEIDGTFEEPVGGGPMTGGRIESRPGFRMVGAIVEGPEGNVFLKLTGPSKTARAMEEGLRAMVGSATRVAG